ncbi:MAG: hypothetical protein OXF25_10685 [Cyanobacteria bacterium MAG CAR3_bin_5]|nr:hypothetical protein [Cyanobacteria bacterium MAG CAR3_bin_5]
MKDNDPTRVTLEGLGVDLPEGASTNLSVRLSRVLVTGETLPVALTFGGAASTPNLTSADYTLSPISRSYGLLGSLTP